MEANFSLQSRWSSLDKIMKQSASLAFLVTIIYRGHQVKSLKYFSLFIQMSLPTKKKDWFSFIVFISAIQKENLVFLSNSIPEKKTTKRSKQYSKIFAGCLLLQYWLMFVKKKTGLTNYGPLVLMLTLRCLFWCIHNIECEKENSWWPPLSLLSVADC